MQDNAGQVTAEAGAVNTQGFVWKRLCAVYKFPFIHSYYLLPAQPIEVLSYTGYGKNWDIHAAERDSCRLHTTAICRHDLRPRRRQELGHTQDEMK